MTTETNANRTRIRVVRSDGREWPTMAIAYRELIGSHQEIGSSEHQRIRAALRSGSIALDRHGFTWKSFGGVVSEQTIAWSDFTFGVELELVAPMSMHELQQLLRTTEHRNWEVVHDGSLSSERGLVAMEVVSPVLQGQAGIASLKAVLDLLRAKGCRVNASCGMHVHVGVRGMKVERLRKIAIAFVNAEGNFDALVPPSRRNNRYCNSNRNVANWSQLTTATTVRQLGEAMNRGNSNDHYNQFRYYKLNFQSFVRHGTIEFRQHAGTVESEKACQWVRLITGFCAAAASAEQQAPQQRVTLDQMLQSSCDEAGQRYMQARAEKFSAAARRAA